MLKIAPKALHFLKFLRGDPYYLGGDPYYLQISERD